MKRTAVTIDPWTYFDFKEQMQGSHDSIVQSWIPTDDRRRLTSYKLQESYYRNAAREWMKTGVPDDIREGRREYGDPKTIRDAIISSLIGDDISFLIDGAEADEGVEADEQALAFFQLLQQWRVDERYDQKVIERERNSVGLGDGVVALSWNEKSKRPTLTVYDPGFYFPVLDPSTTDEFPEVVNLAWEYEVDTDQGTKKYLRRLKWRLELISPHDDNGVQVDEEDEFSTLFNNESVDEFGQITRKYPWGDSSETCVFSDTTWDLSKTNSDGLNDLSEEAALISSGNIDMQMDFLPVIHYPHSVALQEHFGVSCLAQVMQVLDDLVSTDTDLQASAATTGSPPIALAGSSAPKDSEGRIKSYGPGTVFETGDGTATMIDTSRSLDALLKYKDSQQERLATNSRVPESLLGKVKPNEVPSGIALTLSFTPHSQLIREARLVRADKDRLMLKFIGRMYWYNGVLTFSDNVPRAEVIYGSFLPADKQEVASLASTLLQTTPPAISVETAVKMLMSAGFPIEDALEEISRIESRDFEGAIKILESTGDITAVYKYLQLGTPPASAFPGNEPIDTGGQ